MSDNLREYEGGQTIEIPVTLASIPMFLRGSAIVATSEDVKHILRDTMHQLDLLVAAETDTSFVLYDDDGHTEDYKNGVYAKTTIDVKAGDRTDIHFSTVGSVSCECAEDSHIHLEVKQGEKYLDPAKVMQ